MSKNKKKHVKSQINNNFNSYPEVQKALDIAKLSGSPDDISNWWFLKNRAYYTHFAELGMGEFYENGIIVKYAYEWDPYCKNGPQLHPYPVEINPIYIPWTDFYDAIFDEYGSNLERLYELYPDVVRSRWKRNDKTVDEWYEDIFNSRYAS